MPQIPPETPHVEVADAAGVEQRGVRGVVGVARVAALDDQVARPEHLGERAHGVAGGLARRDHDPDDPRCGERGREVGERGDVADLGPRVVADDLVARGPHPVAHVATHPAEPDESELHVKRSCVWGGQPGSRTGISRWR